MARMVITANRLKDGAVVWRDVAGGWSTDIAMAEFHLSDGALAEALDTARADQAAGCVVGVYEVEVSEGRSFKPVRLRERIRAKGPTVLFA